MLILEETFKPFVITVRLSVTALLCPRLPEDLYYCNVLQSGMDVRITVG